MTPDELHESQESREQARRAAHMAAMVEAAVEKTSLDLHSTACAELIFVNRRTWQRWMNGSLPIQQGPFELFCVKTGLDPVKWAQADWKAGDR